MKKFIDTVKSVPLYGWVAGVVFLLSEYSLYLFGTWIAKVTGTINWAVTPKIPFIDNNIPYVGAFILVYVFAYVFWALQPAAVSLTGKKNFTDFAIASLASFFVGFLIFIFMPTIINRSAEHAYENAEKSIFRDLILFIYNNDGNETVAYNLFPSFHCLVSMCCYLGVRKRPELSKGFRAYSLVMTILICMSTVLLKQHYFLDIVSGVLIPTVCFAVVRKIRKVAQ